MPWYAYNGHDMHVMVLMFIPWSLYVYHDVLYLYNARDMHMINSDLHIIIIMCI